MRDNLQQLAASDFPLTDSHRLFQADLISWVQSKEPGYLIKRLLCNVTNEGLTVRQRGKAGHKAAVRLMSLDQIMHQFASPKCSHLRCKKKFLRGSIHTDGHRFCSFLLSNPRPCSQFASNGFQRCPCLVGPHPPLGERITISQKFAMS